MKKITPLFIMLMLLTSTIIVAVADKPNDGNNGDTKDNNNGHTGENKTGDHDNDTNDNNNETDHQNNDNETGDHDGNGNETGESDDRNQNQQDNETEHEIEIMNTTLGAAIRLLQLEKALLTNILKGAMTVQVLKGLAVNTTRLETILAELHETLTSVQAADPSANTSVQLFIDLKNQTKNLTKQFRETLRTLLDNETISRLREQLRNITSDELQNCSHALRFKIRQFNRNQLYRLYGIIGEINNTLLNDYINGNISLNQTKIQIHKIVNQMTKEKQQHLFSTIKEEDIKKQIRAHEHMDEYGRHGKRNGQKNNDDNHRGGNE